MKKMNVKHFKFLSLFLVGLVVIGFVPRCAESAEREEYQLNPGENKLFIIANDSYYHCKIELSTYGADSYSYELRDDSDHLVAWQDSRQEGTNLVFIGQNTYSFLISNPNSYTITIFVTISLIPLEGSELSYFTSETIRCWKAKAHSDEPDILSVNFLEEGYYDFSISVLGNGGSVKVWFPEGNPTNDPDWVNTSSSITAYGYNEQKNIEKEGEDMWIGIQSIDGKDHNVVLTFTYHGETGLTLPQIFAIALAGVAIVGFMVTLTIKKQSPFQRHTTRNSRKDLQKQSEHILTETVARGMIPPRVIFRDKKKEK